MSARNWQNQLLADMPPSTRIARTRVAPSRAIASQKIQSVW